MATRKSSAVDPTASKVSAPAAPAKRSAAKALKPTAADAVATTAAGTPKATEPKHKLVRDSFTIPKNEYAVLGLLKQRATSLTRPAKKSEILRAGIGALHAMSDKAYLAALESVPSLKTGRPTQDKAAAGKVAAKKS